MVIKFVVQVIIIVAFVISLIIIYFPLSIYELVSKSYTYDPSNDINQKYNDNKLKIITLFMSNNTIYKAQGNITFDVIKNTITFKFSGNTYTFDIINDIDKYIAMYILANSKENINI
ncbi:hypothetical protein MseVgp049 [Melanoplus sanguinipes entomopoxvirus]|uniref:Entry-fusion complex protein OPG086 n=1 Tax=Melanoplus sanguinipes entomopoxvirus TaxID=83191 RepID=Q9YW43_MSEPV|nr:hypothetical protein MseVgp049 [Melanoplus sanguinipes entomopoxvirus]AAC97827.1 ORF MSV049 hypothetical protein [Melanoplus sanguinipes entomopoxvirus 'O']